MKVRETLKGIRHIRNRLNKLIEEKIRLNQNSFSKLEIILNRAIHENTKYYYFNTVYNFFRMFCSTQSGRVV
jgi:hypothetical protein